ASNAPQGDATVQVEVAGTTYDVALDASGVGTLTVAHGNVEDVYKDGSSVTATVTGVTGGNYEAVDFTGASATAGVTDTTNTTTIGIEATGNVEGDGTVSFTVTASNAPQGDATVQVKIGETVYDVALDSTGVGTLTVAHGNAEDVYKDGSSVTATVTGVTGGNYEAVDFTGATATASVTDTIDTTTFTLKASPVDIDGNVTFSVTADHAPHSTDTVTVLVQVQGESQPREVSIGADGKGSFSVAIGEDGTVSASITRVQHSKYEDVAFSEDAASVTAVKLDAMSFATQDEDVRTAGSDSDAQALATGVTLTQKAVDAVNASIDFGTFSLADGKLVFTQNKAYSHAEGTDSATLGPVSFNATDANGNAALLNVTVAITDDGPAIRGLDAVSVHAGKTASDTFSIDFGADSGDGAEVSFSVGGTVLEQTGDGTWSADLGDGQSITVTQGEGGEFSYSLSYDSATAGAGFEHELTVQVTDADKDAVSQTVTIEVQNDAPTASSDVLHIGKEAQGGTSTSAGVVITLDKNSDGDTCVVSVLGEKSGFKKISYDGDKPRNVEASVVYGDKDISDTDIATFRSKFFKDLVDNNVDLENLTSSNLTNIKFVDADSDWNVIKSAAQEANSKGMLLYITGDLTIKTDFNFTCTTIINGDLTIDKGKKNNANDVTVGNFLYVMGDVTTSDQSSLSVTGGLAVEGDLNLKQDMKAKYSIGSFSLPNVSITYETEGVELATESREITFADLLENDWDSDAAHHSDLDMDSLAITEFRITDSEGVLHIITVDGVHTKMVDGEAVVVEASADGMHTIVVRETQKLDEDGNPVTDEQGNPVIDRDSVTFDCEGESITMVSGGSNTQSVEFQYQVKDAHGATDLADVSMQVTATSEAGSEGSDIIQGSTTTLVDGAHYNIAVSMDRSSSMKDEISTAKEAVKNFIDSLWDEAVSKDSVVNLHFNAFDGDLEYSTSWQITKNTSQDEVAAMKNYISFGYGSGTNYATAFRDMTDWFQKMEAEQAGDGVTYTNKVIFITDGEPFTETHNTERDFNLLKGECGDIHTIGINVGNGLSLSKLNPYDTTAKGAELISSADELAAALEAVTTNLPNADATFANKGDDLLFGDQASFSYEGHTYSLAQMVKVLSGSAADPTAAEIITFAKEHAAELNKYLVDAANDQPDALIGGEGVDVLYGMGADDLIIGGGSNTSGEGDTRLELAEALGLSFADDASSITLTSGLTKGVKQAVADALASDEPEAAISSFNELIEDLENGTDSGDMLFGNSGADVIFGMDGSDFIDGGAGSDILFGGSGSDIFVYDSTDALIHGGSGIDILLSEDDSLESLLGTDKVHDIELFVKGDGAESLTSLTALQDVGVNVGSNSVTLSEAWTAQSDGTFINETANLTIETTLEAEIAGQQIILQNQ
ncbi:MAG: VWA domain-containing protein, partial [Mailhella sp.]|nr:VWA domain-containing protein [Mailhella sp.]